MGVTAGRNLIDCDGLMDVWMDGWKIENTARPQIPFHVSHRMEFGFSRIGTLGFISDFDISVSDFKSTNGR
ncbi:MAG: hypothetical protein DRP64_17195 [Verrucomicrobia bacterium]|nr:MAG: hypothetical protein DRP64_17195 [Verrucomicrobiota bacterium]